VKEEVPALDPAAPGPDLDQSPAATRVLPLAPVAETALVEVEDRGRAAHSITWK
jgi:hypothetical protein